VDALVVHEVSGPQPSGNPSEIWRVEDLYGVDVEGVILDSRAGRHDHAAAEVASVADGDVNEISYGYGLMVAVRKGEAHLEGFALEVGSDGRVGIG